jgi:hypothetical protein
LNNKDYTPPNFEYVVNGVATPFANTAINLPISPLTYGAVGNSRTVTDAATTALSNVVTSAAAQFTPADTGKLVTIWYAGAAGLGTPLNGIATYQNSTTITVSVAATNSLTGARLVIGTDDTIAMNSAITAAKALGKGLIFPSGYNFQFVPNTKLYLTGVPSVEASGASIHGAEIFITTPMQWHGGSIYDTGRHGTVGSGTDGPEWNITGSHVFITDVAFYYIDSYTAIQAGSPGMIDLNIKGFTFTVMSGSIAATPSGMTVTAGAHIRISNGSMLGVPPPVTADDGIVLQPITGPINDVTITNITVEDMADVIKIQDNTIAPNYTLSNVAVSNITAKYVFYPIIFFTLLPGSTYTNISVSNVEMFDDIGSRARGFLEFICEGGADWHNISLSGLHFRGRTDATSGLNQPLRIITDSSIISNLRVNDLVWDDLYNGVAHDGSHPGYPVNLFMYYQSKISGTDTVATDWKLENLWVNGVALFGIDTTGSISPFTITNSYFKNLYVTDTTHTTFSIFDTANFSGVNNVFVPLGTQTAGVQITAPTPLGNNIPAWLQFVGDGSGGAVNCSGTYAPIEAWVSSFTVTLGHTCTSNLVPFIIRSTGACIIAGTVNVRGADGGNTASGGGDLGGTGGGGGGGTAAGVAGVSNIINNTTIAAGGTAGGAGGVAGGNGNTPISARQLTYLSIPVASMRGGSKGGIGGSSGGAPGTGGGAIVLVCASINFTGTIAVTGGTGGDSTGNNVGPGGGGGAGYVIISAPVHTATSGAIITTGGAPGSCLSYTNCGTGGTGGDGWSKIF